MQIELSKQKKMRRKRTKTNGEEFGQRFYSSNWGSVEPTSSVCGGARAAAASYVNHLNLNLYAELQEKGKRLLPHGFHQLGFLLM